jgi:hypothetical protein
VALSELVEIKEEFLHSDPPHDNGVLKSILNILWVIGYLDSFLHKSIIDNIQALGCCLEIGLTCISQLTMEEWALCLWMLFWVLNEDILWLIDISTELEIINFSNISSVEIFTNQNLEKLLLWWNQIQLLHNTSELFNGDMAAICSVIILELWLN